MFRSPLDTVASSMTTTMGYSSSEYLIRLCLNIQLAWAFFLRKNEITFSKSSQRLDVFEMFSEKTRRLSSIINSADTDHLAVRGAAAS